MQEIDDDPTLHFLLGEQALQGPYVSSTEMSQESIYEALVKMFNGGAFFDELNFLCRHIHNEDIALQIMQIRAEIQLYLPPYQRSSKTKTNLKRALEAQQTADYEVTDSLVELARLLYLAIKQPNLQ